MTATTDEIYRSDLEDLATVPLSEIPALSSDPVEHLLERLQDDWIAQVPVAAFNSAI